jgi:hypothetical protein
MDRWCKNCGFWDRNEPGIGGGAVLSNIARSEKKDQKMVGICRRFPPDGGMWALTIGNQDWCGEFSQ